MDATHALREMMRAELLSEIEKDVTQPDAARRRARELLEKLGAQLSLDRALGIADRQRAPSFDRRRVYALVTELPVTQRGTVMQFAHWVWNDENDMDAVEAIVVDLLARRPANPYAYYAPGSESRSHVAGRARSERQEREAEAIKNEEKSWIKGMMA